MTKVWNVRLVEWAESVRGQPFAWGETDCGTLLRTAWRDLLDGEDPTPKLRYKTARGAKGVKWESLLNEIADEIHVGLASSGDAIVLDADEALPTIRVVVTPRFEMCVEEDGAVEMRRRGEYPPDARAWRLRRG